MVASAFTRRLLLAVGVSVAAAGISLPALAQDKVVFGTNWRAQAEHGGYYQAVAKGLYKKHNLDVDIRQGGPQVNHLQLFAAGKIDFYMGNSDLEAFNMVKAGVPAKVVAAIFQKDPQVLMAHPGVGNDRMEDLKGKPILISSDAVTGYWQFLKAAYGFTDSQIRPYTFNPGPFLADKNSAQQGYVTSEPYVIEKEAKFKPVVFLLADHGFDTYSTTIVAMNKLIADKPDLVQRFVNATIEGWYDYLNGDPAPGNALIRKDNPDMTDDQLAYSIKAMKEYGIAVSGDATTQGLGAMTDARWKSFFDKSVQVGMFPADFDFKAAYTTQFVNKKHGMN